MNKLMIISGPTGVGKSSIAVKYAQRYGGEIISADSMQVYKYMDIGSAKITVDEMKEIPHYLLDVVHPSEGFDVVKYKTLAKEAVADIQGRGKLPIIVGGTGFYIQSVLYDIDFDRPNEEDLLSGYYNSTDHTDTDSESDKRAALTDIRSELEGILESNGAAYLHSLLKAVDPKAAEEIHPNNSKRVIRALEYNRQTGLRISDHNREQRQRSSPYDHYYFALVDDRELIYKNIDLRVDKMMEMGLVNEVKALMDMGLDKTCVSMQGLGYKEIYDFLSGNLSKEQAVYIIKRDSRHYAKRQLTWLRREKDVHWIDKRDFDRDNSRIIEYMHNIVEKGTDYDLA